MTWLTGIPRAEFGIFKYAFQRLAKGKKINFCAYCAEKGFVELVEDPIFNVKKLLSVWSNRKCKKYSII